MEFHQDYSIPLENLKDLMLQLQKQSVTLIMIPHSNSLMQPSPKNPMRYMEKGLCSAASVSKNEDFANV